MEQLRETNAEEDIVLMKDSQKQVDIEFSDRNAMNMLNGVYKLVTNFNLDV